jgi:hypothetical protein
VRSLVVYTAAGCHLCEAALEVIDDVRAQVAFELRIVDIAHDAELDARYRELLPVVEIDGEQAFTWFVDPDALRERLGPRPSRGNRSGAGDSAYVREGRPEREATEEGP